MPRIKLVEQTTYKFRCRLEVQPRDVNYGGHLGNDSLVSLVGTARARMFRIIGLSELDLGDGRTGMVMTDLVVNYRSEGFLFDELLVETHPGELARTGFRLFHRVSRDDKVIALLETGFAAFDYVSRKVAPLPQRFVEAVTE